MGDVVCRLLEAGGGDRDARSAARDSGSEHKHGGGRPQRWGVVCAPLWRDAERTREFSFVHAGRGGGAGAADAGQQKLLISTCGAECTSQNYMVMSYKSGY